MSALSVDLTRFTVDSTLVLASSNVESFLVPFTADFTGVTVDSTHVLASATVRFLAGSRASLARAGSRSVIAGLPPATVGGGS